MSLVRVSLSLDLTIFEQSDRTAYTPLVDVKHGTVDDLRNFAVVVVSARVFEPRQGRESIHRLALLRLTSIRRPDESSLVRLRVTDPSLDRDDDGGDTQEIPTIDVEWYEQDRTRIPNFVPRHVLLARNFSVSPLIPCESLQVVDPQFSLQVARGKITRVHNSWSLALDPDELVNPELRASHVGRPFRGGPKGNTNLELSEPEIAHAARLAEIYHERPFPAAEKVAAKPARVGRLREIKDVEPDHFCDLYAEVSNVSHKRRTSTTKKMTMSYSRARQVVKCYVPADDRSPVSLYVTDYTENAQLVDYSSTSHSSSHASSRQFPPGRQTLQVSIFDHQFEPLAHVSERGDLVGRFVRIDNLRPKLQGDDLLECTLVDDAKFPAKRYLRLLPKGGFLADPIKALLRYAPLFASFCDSRQAFLPTPFLLLRRKHARK